MTTSRELEEPESEERRGRVVPLQSAFTASRRTQPRTLHGRPKGYINEYRPQRKTLALLADVGAVLEEYRDHWPLTVRQIFYRLIGLGGYVKSNAFYERLAEALVKARRARIVSFDAIRDDGVCVIEAEHYASVDAFNAEMLKRARRYRRDKLAGQNVSLEVLCEAAGMQPQLAEVAGFYSVPVYSSGGFDSLTAKYELVKRAIWQRKRVVILHLGDYDPHGEMIFDSLAKDVTAFFEADKLDGYSSIEFRRVALTAEQVTAYNLPTAPAKMSDALSRAWSGETCQLEALSPDVLAGILRTAIEQFLDFGLLRADIEQEAVERLELTKLLSAPREGQR